ncbi:retention module-containing protein, partial [Hydrogenovibrio sp. JE_KL2]|uniref:retention module-containing protein n=1 Tax=Hydrogenovibrio sp. JE_KL2 TaxID=2651188 RepID=UPI001562681C
MAASNSVVIGRVGEITGVVYIKLPSGELVQLKEGMVVHADDVIVTADGGSILIYLADGTVFTLGQNSVARLDDDVMPRATAEELQAQNQDDVKDLAQKVLSGHADDLSATAAGENGQPLSSSSQTPDAVQADRAQGNVTSGFDTGTPDGQGNGQPDDQTGNSQNSFFTTQQAVFSVSLDIDRITSDSLVNAQEANGTINVTGTVTGLNLDHGTVTLTVNGKNYSGTYGSDGKYSIAVPGTDFVNDSDQIVQATTTGFNQQGEQATSTSTEFYLIDTSAGRVYIDPITGDNIVAGNEDKSVTISGSTRSIAAGQTVTIEVQDSSGNVLFDSTTLPSSQQPTVGVDGKWSITGVDMSSWPDDANYKVIANSVDSSGNPAIKGEEDFTTRVTQDDSIIIQENTVANGNVLANDSNPNNTLKVASFTISGDSTTHNAGDSVTISGVGQMTLNADGSYTFTPVHDWDGTVPQITYTTNSDDSSKLDIKVEPAGSVHVGTVTIDPVTQDNVVNASEAGNNITVTGTASGGEIKSGDTVTMVINGTTYTGTVGTDNKWSASVKGSDLEADSDKTFTATVTSKDSSGATVISNADHTYSVDTQIGTPGHTGSDAVSIDSITQDTGSNTSDFKTSDQTLSVSGKAYLETGDTLTVSF